MVLTIGIFRLMECLVYIQVLGTDMKIHPRTWCGIVVVGLSTIGIIIQKTFNLNVECVFVTIGILSVIIIIPLHIYMFNVYYSEDDNLNQIKKKESNKGFNNDKGSK